MDEHPPASIEPSEADAFVSGLLQRADAVRRQPPPSGTRRGVDCYMAQVLREVVTRSLPNFVRIHGALPRLDAPERATEKLYLAKFFMPVPVPSFADKLRVPFAIPETARSLLRPIEAIWTSRQATLPADAALPAGRYWLKATHGSDMNLRITWPPAPAARAAAEQLAGTWLATSFGPGWGEWWYALVRRALLLCREIGTPSAPPCDYKFFVANGRVVSLLVSHYLGSSKQRARSFYDVAALWCGIWRKLPVTLLHSPNPDMPRPPAITDMLHAAAEIGRHCHAVRVDLMCDASAVYLTELTYCDHNALAVYTPSDFDREIGAAWDISAWWRPP
jgi:hypothetical protein